MDGAERRALRIGESGSLWLFGKRALLPWVRLSSGLGILLLFVAFSASVIASERDLQSACQSGNGRGCLQLGFLYERGKIARKKDPKRAYALYMQACSLKVARGCTDAGILQERGSGVKADTLQALAWYHKGCEGLDQKGCYLLASWLEQELSRLPQGILPDALKSWFERDLAEAVETLYDRACQYGSGVACHLLASRLQRLLLAKESTTRLAMQKRAAMYAHRACKELEESAACVGWGLMVERGWGRAAAPAKAHAIWEKACLKRQSLACLLLGLRFRDGLHQRKAPYRAARFFRLACQQKKPEGCLLLAMLYDEGFGKKSAKAKNAQQALSFYEKACQLGSHQGCFQAAVRLEKKKPVKKNLPKALLMYKKACQLGYKKACRPAPR